MGQIQEKILIVDDEKEIADLVEVYLKNDGYQVYKFYNGTDALACVEQEDISLAVLDLMLPDMDGFVLCQKIRESHLFPIIMLTARVEDIDKITGLTLGADDYITKPFNILEVKARIKAIMRRTGTKEVPQTKARVVKSGDLELDLESRRLFILGKETNLTAREFELLELFVTNQNKVFSREKLLELVWGVDYPGDVRTVDVHVRRLREKIEANPSEPKYVHTKWGVGYYYRG